MKGKGRAVRGELREGNFIWGAKEKDWGDGKGEEREEEIKREGERIKGKEVLIV